MTTPQEQMQQLPPLPYPPGMVQQDPQASLGPQRVEEGMPDPNAPICPLSGQPCLGEPCGWFNTFTGFCWVPEVCLIIKRNGGRY